MSNNVNQKIIVEPPDNTFTEIRIRIPSNCSWRWSDEFDVDENDVEYEGKRATVIYIVPWEEAEREEHKYEIPHHWR